MSALDSLLLLGALKDKGKEDTDILDKYLKKSLLRKLKDLEKKKDDKGPHKKWSFEDKILLACLMTFIGPVVGMGWWLMIRGLANAVVHQ